MNRSEEQRNTLIDQVFNAKEGEDIVAVGQDFDTTKSHAYCTYRMRLRRN